MSTIVKKNGTSKAISPFRNWMERFWDADSLFGRDLFADDFSSRTNWLPAVNVKDNGKDFEIEVAAPGLKKEDFEVSIENGILHIQAEKETSLEETEENYTRKEFSYNKFQRSFTLPDNIIEDSIEAKYDNGVLKLKLEKTEVAEKKATKVDVK